MGCAELLVHIGMWEPDVELNGSDSGNASRSHHWNVIEPVTVDAQVTKEMSFDR